MCGKSVIIAICLLATLIGIAAGLKCYHGHAKTGSGDDAYIVRECDYADTCVKSDCDGPLAGHSIKGCYNLPPGADISVCSPAECTSPAGIKSGGICSYCRGDLCNSGNMATNTNTDNSGNGKPNGEPPKSEKSQPASDNGLIFHHPITIPLLIAIGAMMTVLLGHYLL